MEIVAYVLATIIPLIFLYVIYALDLYKMGAFRYVLACFAWGAVAFGAASLVNRTLYLQHLVSRDDIIRYTAPVAEELLKALILVYLVRRPNFTYFVDGALYGFAVGIGFAVFENYQYLMYEADGGLGTAIGRVLSANLIHASASALVGVALGLARFRRSLGHLLTLLAGLLIAMALHSVYNNLVTRAEGGMIMVYGAGLGFSGVALIAFLIFRGLAEQKVWIREKLGMADRVTDKEARVVDQLADTQTLLEPLAKLYGQEKAEQIEQFLLTQARLGILRKTLDKLPDAKMRQAIEKQMADLRLQMDAARRKVGSYCMASVRLIFPPDDRQLFQLMEARIQQARQARPASGGLNLWATLGQRAAAKPAEAQQTEVTEHREE
jgi:RsiW-degrading membrane proteinase PrsW (M82 family)